LIPAANFRVRGVNAEVTSQHKFCEYSRLKTDSSGFHAGNLRSQRHWPQASKKIPTVIPARRAIHFV
jgi:hypothetical protein